MSEVTPTYPQGYYPQPQYKLVSTVGSSVLINCIYKMKGNECDFCVSTRVIVRFARLEFYTADSYWLMPKFYN